MTHANCLLITRKLNIRTVAVYTEPDAASTHVHLADQAVLLSGHPSKAYIDGYDHYSSSPPPC